MENTFSRILKYLLFATALTPLIVTKLTPFPFVAGKTFFYRSLIEIALIVFAVYLMLKTSDVPKLKTLFKNKLFLFVSLFMLSAAISTVFAPNSYRAFFGDIERGEGFLGLLHYFIFLVFAVTLFKKEDWLKFFKLSLVVLLVMIFYAWLQYFGVTEFPFALGPSAQTGSFTGNPAFFSSYLIISLAIAAIVFYQHKSAKSAPISGQSFWQYFSIVVAALAVATIFITQIRGAILGIAVGVLFLLLYFPFSKKPLIPAYEKLIPAHTHQYKSAKISINQRTIAAAAIVLLVAFGATFFATREAAVWQAVPGLKRFAQVSFDIPSVTTRFIALGVSWNAFKEKPLLGWGPENYNVAYNKHYDPAYSLYAEDWFDRAHNKVAEVAVIQGGVGLILYLGLFASLFSLLFQRKIAGYSFLAASFIAYFVQNLFLFDNVASYLSFFAVLGFIISETSNRRISAVPNISTKDRAAVSGNVNVRRLKLQKLISVIVSIIVIALSLYSLYFYIYIPYVQSRRYVLASRLRVGDKILAATDGFLYPYTFAQITIRSQFHDFLYDNNLFANRQFRPLIDKSLAALEEVMEKEPYDPRHYARLIEGYNELAKGEKKFFEQSLIFAEKALALSPRRQGLNSHLAFVLAGLGRYEEAIAVGRRSVELAPLSAKAHLNLGITLALAAEDEKNKGTPQGERYKEEALRELDKAFELGMTVLGGSRVYEGDNLTNTQFLLFIEFDFKNMMTIYRGFGRLDRVFEVLKIALNEKRFATASNEDFLHDGIVLGRLFRDKEAIIEYAQRLKKINPALADDMDVIIDLAQKEKWEILDEL